MTRSLEYTVYGIADCRTYLLYYVGYSDNPWRRYREHLNRWAIQELQNQGIPLVLYPLQEHIPSLELAREIETRWIYHAIQMRQPLINTEYRDTELVRRLQKRPDLDLLNLSEQTNVWIDVLIPALFPRERTSPTFQARYNIGSKHILSFE